MQSFKSFIGFEENENLDEAKYSPEFEEGKTYKMRVGNKIVDGICVVESTSIAILDGRAAFFRIKKSGTKNPVYVAGRIRKNNGIEYIDDEIQGLAVAAAPGIFDDDFEEFIGNPDDIKD